MNDPTVLMALESRLHAISSQLIEAKLLLQKMKEKRSSHGPPSTSLPGYLSIEVDGTAGTIQPLGTSGTVLVENRTGEDVRLQYLKDTAQAGSLGVLIPNDQDATIQKPTDMTEMNWEFIRYEFFDPCDPVGQPGTACIIQVYRFPAIEPTPENPNPHRPQSADGLTVNRITLQKNEEGGLALTVGH